MVRRFVAQLAAGRSVGVLLVLKAGPLETWPCWGSGLMPFVMPFDKRRLWRDCNLYLCSASKRRVLQIGQAQVRAQGET